MEINKRKKRQEQIINLLLFPTVFLYYEILFKIFGSISPGNLFILFLFTLAAGEIAGFIYLIIPQKKIKVIFAEIIMLLLSIFFITECFVGKAFQTFMTLESLFTGAGDAMGDFGNVIVRTIISGWYIILLYLIPVILFQIFYKKLIDTQKISFANGAVILSIALLSITAGHFIALEQDVYTDGYQYDLSVRTMGVFTTFWSDLRLKICSDDESEKFVVTDTEEADEEVSEIEKTDEISRENEPEVIEEKETEVIYEPQKIDFDFESLSKSASVSSVKNLDLFLQTQTPAMKNQYTGLFKEKNLILICAEAFSPYAVTEELMPTLYRMMHHGFYFSDYYQPAWGGSTSTGEFSVLMGLIPTKGVKSVRETQDHNLYFTIGNQLSGEGYYSAAYHNNSYTYYSRNKTHQNFGYELFMGMGNGMEKGVEDCWPQSDLEMIDFTVSQYIDQQPFHVYYMTVSGHCGYSRDGNAMSKKNWDKVQHLEFSDTVKAYIASQMELEYAMQSLIEKLDTAGILDDTVICLTSDHYPYGLEKGGTWENSVNYLAELYGSDQSEWNKFAQDKNALIIWSGSLENDQKEYAKEISDPVYSLDILPTLSNLFGAEYDSRIFVGRDVFSEDEALVIWPDYSWKTDKASYDARTGKITSVTGEEVPQEYIEKINTMVKNKFNLSKVPLEYDYWNHITGN